MIDGRVIEILEDNIKSTLTVYQWSIHCKYDCPKKFSRDFKKFFGISPKSILIEKRLLFIKRYLKLNKEDIFYSSALELGFENDQALYKFVKRHTDKSLTDFIS